MSYTTRCPACATMFKVVPEQLKVSGGWVRCGHCADVFDATLYLANTARPATVPVSVASAPTPSAVPSARAVASSRSVNEGGESVLDSSRRRSEPVASAASATAEFPEREGLRGESTGGLQTARDFADELKQFARSAPKAQPRPDDVDLAPAAAAVASALQAVAAPSDPESTARSPWVADSFSKPDESEPGFVRQGRRRAFWRSPLMRALQASAALLLALLLLVQWMIQERDWLAAEYPTVLPLLVSLCRPWACQVGPVRRIESVFIDSSHLVRNLGNGYSFDLVLKNSATMAVAVPALELSLTDTQDTVISRRVFLPNELPGAPALLPPRSSLSIALRLAIADNGASSMAGYRALVFYP